jgi:hypothetical protein
MRNHLDCQSLSGIDLVQDFCLGEPKLLRNHHSSTHPIHVALALLEDSGWYAVNYDVAVPSATGFGQGCDYLQSLSEDECPECTADVVSMPCDSSHYIVTSCASDCPVAIDCYSSAVGLAMIGETFGATSRCFDTIDQQQRGLCLKTKCDNDGNAVVIVNDQEYLCNAPGKEFSSSGMTWRCPSLILCPHTCPSSCAGRGICSEKSTCQCFDAGDTTPDCSATHELLMSNSSATRLIVTHIRRRHFSTNHDDASTVLSKCIKMCFYGLRRREQGHQFLLAARFPCRVLLAVCCCRRNQTEQPRLLLESILDGRFQN